MILKLTAAALVAATGHAAIAQAPPLARATLASPTDETGPIAVKDAVWRCVAATCSGASGDGKFGDISACRDLAKKIGRVATFSSARGELSPDQLIRCNQRAKAPR